MKTTTIALDAETHRRLRILAVEEDIRGVRGDGDPVKLDQLLDTLLAALQGRDAVRRPAGRKQRTDDDLAERAGAEDSDRGMHWRDHTDR